MEGKFSRRVFFKLTLSGFAVAPLFLKAAKSTETNTCPATPPEGKPVVSPTEGVGKSLGYTLDAKTTKNALYKVGQNCGNSAFYNSLKIENGHSTCAMMGFKYVTNCGWCKVYKPKPKV